MEPTEKERIVISLYQEGLSVPEVAAHHGMSDAGIYYILRKHGVTLRRRIGIGKVLTEFQEQEIISLYQSGISGMELSVRYKVADSTIYELLKRSGIKARTNSEIFRKLTDAQELEVIAAYQRGLPGSRVARLYGINDESVYNILERNGIKRRTISESSIIYPRNEHAFDVIDSEVAAYWLGFIAADGNVSNGRLRIGLSTRDADHVLKFAAWLAPNMPLYRAINNLGRPVTSFDIGSKYLVETLAKYGIVPRKTYIMKQLPSVPYPLLRHLLRGYADADGYLSVDSAEHIRFGVVAYNREIVKEIQSWLINEVGVSQTSLIRSGTGWHYRQYGRYQVTKIVTYLYSDASIYLERKYLKAQKLMK